ncbi:MAG: GNAT family N-acetyltransferase [Thermomicrobiales bacterium]|jgi:RimJ/RimL family protein N-acetyltransferase|nr:GNAT family N-acetyltransferase [Thermomicrobiales bacterium]
MIEPGAIVEEKTIPQGVVVIRYPQEGDAPGLLEFINRLSEEQTFILFQGEQLTLEQEESWLSGRLNELATRSGITLCAMLGDLVVGTTAITRKGLAERHIGVLGISIRDGYRGAGLGGALFDAVVREAATHLDGLRIVELGVFGNNPVARRLYESRGFEVHGVLPGGVRHRGEYVDHILMHRMIEQPA